MTKDDLEKEIAPTEEELQAAMAQEFPEGTAESADVTTESVATEAFIPVETVLPSDLEDPQIKSIIESLLFASIHPISFAQLKSVFYNTNVDSDRLRDILAHLETDYSGGERGILLEEVSGGYQLRTKVDNAGWLRKLVKARPFRLSGPALEVLSIISYKQPMIKSEIDDIRGVESGHLVRALMEKNLVKFAGKSELPGKPMLYGTTKQFLELFGLRNIRELPTLSEIDKLIPEGIGETSEIDGETLGSLADKIAMAPGKSYSEAETELLSITDALSGISTSSEFFEQEKIREREKRDNERAQDLRERQIVGETLPDADIRWLLKFDAKFEAKIAAEMAPVSPTELVYSTEEKIGSAGEKALPFEEPKENPRQDVASHAAEAAAAASSLWDDGPTDKDL
jgi:segregation and condensation protein B